jgi:hypothetical protein
VEIFLSLLYILLFLFLIRKSRFFKIEGLSFGFLSFAFILKMVFGILLMLIYSRYYTDRSTADVFKYFDDGKIMYESLFSNPLHFLQMFSGINADAEYLMPYYNEMNFWFKEYDYGIYNDNRTVIRLNALVMLFSFGNYGVHIAFWCFISLTGLTAIFKTFRPIMQGKTPELAFVVFLLPSVLFWGSGVLKEGILLFALGMLIYFYHKMLFTKFSAQALLWVVFSLLILLITKGYIVLALIPTLLSLILIKYTGSKYSFLKFLGTHVLSLLIAINLYRLSNELDVLYYLHQKQKDFINLAHLTDAQSLINTRIFEPHWTSLIYNSPEALLNVMLRPFPWEASNMFALFASVENILMFALIIFFLFFFKKPRKENLPLLFSALFFTLSLAGIIGLVTPILGAVVRYKIPLMPFLLIVFLIPFDKEKMLKKLPFLKFLKFKS